MPKRNHRGEELGRRRVEDPRESLSPEQNDRRAQPTAGEKSTANSRRQEHSQQQAKIKEQKEQCQLQAKTYEENNVSKKEVGPMTRNKDKHENTKIRLERRLKLRSRKQPSWRKPGVDCQEIAWGAATHNGRCVERRDTETTEGIVNR